LQADLTPLFNWNVKQLFVYLTAEYTTPQNQVFRLIGQLRLKGTIEVFGVNWSFLRFDKSSLFATTCDICTLLAEHCTKSFLKTWFLLAANA
jgi:hypothetical protein